MSQVKKKKKVSKGIKKQVTPPNKKAYVRKPTIVAVGLDISMASFSGCAQMYDGLLRKMRGPVWHQKRFFNDEHDFFDRMGAAARGHDFVMELCAQMKGAIFDLDEIYVGVEEPWTFGEVKGGRHGHLRQQAQIQGAFISSLIRWGWPNIFEISIPKWQSMVANDLDIKMRGPEKEWDKWSPKEWALEVYEDIPKWPDLIRNNKKGLIPQPKTSKAKPAQPDDRFDATAMMDWTWNEAQKYVKVEK